MDTHQAYVILELDLSATRDDIKTAYRRKALELHPDKDRTGNDLKFKRVAEAYRLLKDKPVAAAGGSGSRTGAGDRAKGGPGSSPGARSRWGAPPGSPEEDWSRFTREFEESNPGFWKEYERKFWEEYETATKGGSPKEEFEKTREPKRQPNLSVEVDPTLCIGCCSCETIAPEVFEVDRHAHTNPKSRVINERGAGYNKIVNAAETCPTKAIIVEDREAGDRIYPL